ncbi:MAG: flagellar export protein FliJ [Oligoflexia bacterium]|nr:flagellar export protein FliJ [Oligoflexia bacterium]
MKKFKFNLESVLNYKLILEDKEKKSYGKAVKDLSDAEDELTMLNREIVNAYEERKKGIGNDQIDFLKSCTDYVCDSRARCREQKQLISFREKAVSDQQERLVHAIQQRKVFEKIRDKRLRDYKKECRRQEIKVFDDITSTGFAKKKRA